MKLRFFLLAGLVMAFWLVDPSGAPGQVVGGAAYNPYTGTSGAAREGYNPYTGTSAQESTRSNPYTGRTVTEKTATNPYTGTSAETRSVSNPYTGRNTTSYAYRRR
jgi:hypothetical protein